MSRTVPTLPELSVRSYDAPAGAAFSWLREMAGALREQMLVSGAVLVHGLPVDGPDTLAEARDALGIAGHVPSEAFNDRRDFGDGILAPISWPDDRLTCPFQESSFSRTFPSVVLTACLTPPDGGLAHLSDARRIAERLPARLADRVRVNGWTMTRTFHHGFGISWREAFAVPDRDALGIALEAAGIRAEWLPDGALHTVRHLPGVIAHPMTGEQCWFNQISFLNIGSLDPGEREVMVKSFGRFLPMNTYLGEGSTVSGEDLSALHRAYDSMKIGVPWRRGDLLIADNIIMAQGRSAYAGDPEFLVALGAYRQPDRRTSHENSLDALTHHTGEVQVMTQVLADATLQEIRDHLDAVVENGSGTTFQGSESVVRRLAEPKELRALIERITADDDVLADIAARSYCHANNFLKVVLLAGDETNPWKLRLHMWHPKPDATGSITEDVHSHRWDFTTALLVGEYFAQEFRIGPGPEYHHFKYLPIGQGQTFTLEAQGTEQLSTVFEAVLPSGTIYHLEHRVLHCISRSAGKAAASLVLQQPAVTEFTNVYRRSPAGEAKTEVEVQRPSVAQLRDELTHFLTWLD